MLKPIGIMGCARGEGHLARNVLVSKIFSIFIDSRCRKGYFWDAQYKHNNLPLSYSGIQ